jgi:hypothetical protein
MGSESPDEMEFHAPTKGAIWIWARRKRRAGEEELEKFKTTIGIDMFICISIHEM